MSTSSDMKNNKCPKNSLFDACKILHSDYIEYGGKIQKYLDRDYDYADCSCGCKFFKPLHDKESNSEDLDFGVCINKKSNRYGLLTFEHQAGYGCFESDLI